MKDIDWPEEPNEKFEFIIYETMSHLISLTAAVRRYNKAQTKALLRQANDGKNQALGNRSPAYQPTYEDYRYQLISGLKICLEHLENDHADKTE